MFYSETLLAKTGPLARVWLASNLERKLTKQGVLQSNLDDNVKDIIGQGQAPMALRLSGQLLLGVVRIYSRKAKYLLDDCSEALSKIKIAFKPGNVDLPSNQTHTANPNALMLPDTITELDLFAPLPDPEDLLRGTPGAFPNDNTTLLDFGTSQLLPESQTPTRRESGPLLQLEDDDLNLDLGFDMDGPPVRTSPFAEEPSVEIGRRTTPRRDEPTMLEDDDLGLDLGFGDTTIGGESSIRPPPAEEDVPMFGGDEDVPMGGVEDEEIAMENERALQRASQAAESARLQREDSPLSEIAPSDVPDLERTYLAERSALDVEEEEDDETMVRAAQRVKRRRVLPQDSETELHNSQIKKLQEDRSAITRAPIYLPRDPLLLQLMEMQRTGGFVSNILGDGRMQGWAPELRGILSVEVMRKAGEKKRKRDSGVADVETASERQETPRLELPEDEEQEDEGFQAGDVGDFDADTTIRPENELGPLLGSDDAQPITAEDEQEEARALSIQGEDDTYIGAPFDITEAPLLHPSQTGPVSLGTKTAVHLLRQHFAPSHPSNATEPPTPSKRVKSEAVFDDICPVETTTTVDATKMFFELLVLGTKDAVKIAQDKGPEEEGGLGGAIRVRGKRGLWGAWAEMGEPESQTTGTAAAAGGVGEGEGAEAEQGEEVAIEA